MIKIFRNIRHRLVRKSRFSKYLVYAVGEIILVVIGILIALQINNWNQDRKDRVVENQLLKNLRSSLLSDIDNQINPLLTQLESDLKNISDIKLFLKNRDAYHDSMNTRFNTLMYSKNFAYEVTSYKALENEGLQLIKNPKLKSRILKLYNMSYPDIQFVISNFMNNLLSFFRPNMRELFWFMDDNRNKGYMPVDYELLKNNRDFKNNLMVCTENCTNLHAITNNVKAEVESLITLIDEELGNRY